MALRSPASALSTRSSTDLDTNRGGLPDDGPGARWQAHCTPDYIQATAAKLLKLAGDPLRLAQPAQNAELRRACRHALALAEEELAEFAAQQGGAGGGEGLVDGSASDERAARVSIRALRRLRVDYVSEPLALDRADATFSWELVSSSRGAAQESCELTVAGRTRRGGARSTFVPMPEGVELKSDTRYLFSPNELSL